MASKKYKHIFFDLDNTLWDFNNNSYFAMQSAFEHFRISSFNISFDDFFDTYADHNHSLWKQYRDKTISKKDLITRRFKNTFNDCKIATVDPEEMNAFYLEAMPKQKLLTDGALDILGYLKIKGYFLYIITNGFNEVQHKKLESSGIKAFFERIYISEDIKMPKPSIEVFEYAVKSANAKKKQSIMIGDDWDVDILGALQYGMDAVYFSKKNTATNDYSGSNKVYSISKLSDLRLFL